MEGFAMGARFGARSRGAVIAAAIGLGSCWLGVRSAQGQPMDGLVLSIAIACFIAGALAGPSALVHLSRPIFSVTLASYILIILLTPLVNALVALPGAVDGGSIPCLNIAFGSATPPRCPSGLHDGEAISRLIAEALTFYMLSPFSLALLSVVMVPMAALAALWRWLLRRSWAIWPGRPGDGPRPAA
jgi:hypothetical protein